MRERTPIDPAQCKTRPPEAVYSDRITGIADNVMEAFARTIVDNLTTPTIDPLKQMLKLDSDPSLSHDQRVKLIEKYAETVARNRLGAVITDFNSQARLDLDGAAAFGCDGAQTCMQAEAKIRKDLSGILAEAIHDRYERLIADREAFTTQVNSAVQSEVRRVCCDVKTRVEAEDCKELKKIAGYSETLSNYDRRKRVFDFVAVEVGAQAPQIATQLDTTLNLRARADALGMDSDQFLVSLQDNLVERLKGTSSAPGALANSLEASYSRVSNEARLREGATEKFWSVAKWGVGAAGTIATGAVITVLGSFSAPFWIPVGGGATLIAMAVAWRREGAAERRMESW